MFNKKYVYVIFIILLSNVKICSQEIESDTTNYWINFGLGSSINGKNADVLLGTSLNIGLNKNYNFSLRFNLDHEVAIFTNAKYVWDFGVLYGLNSKSNNFLAMVSTGISLVGGIELGKYIPGSGWFSGKYEEINYLTIGLPIEAQLFWIPFKYFGIGLTVNANLNSKKSFAGGMLSIQFNAF